MKEGKAIPTEEKLAEHLSSRQQMRKAIESLKQRGYLPSSTRASDVRYRLHSRKIIYLVVLLMTLRLVVAYGTEYS
ncbi:hypothetical protein ACLK17_18540 [Escherichia coli]